MTYVQVWSGTHLTELYEGVHEVFVRGEGKHGDFHGVLKLDCQNPQWSQWRTESISYMENDSVPSAAMLEIRRLYC